jgi:hypothetical protein
MAGAAEAQRFNERKPGGFGIALIRERATSIEYARVGAANQLTIVCAAINV